MGTDRGSVLRGEFSCPAHEVGIAGVNAAGNIDRRD